MRVIRQRIKLCNRVNQLFSWIRLICLSGGVYRGPNDLRKRRKLFHDTGAEIRQHNEEISTIISAVLKETLLSKCQNLVTVIKPVEIYLRRSKKKVSSYVISLLKFAISHTTNSSVTEPHTAKFVSH